MKKNFYDYTQLVEDIEMILRVFGGERAMWVFYEIGECGYFTKLVWESPSGVLLEKYLHDYTISFRGKRYDIDSVPMKTVVAEQIMKKALEAESALQASGLPTSIPLTSI